MNISLFSLFYLHQPTSIIKSTNDYLYKKNDTVLIFDTISYLYITV